MYVRISHHTILPYYRINKSPTYNIRSPRASGGVHISIPTAAFCCGYIQAELLHHLTSPPEKKNRVTRVTSYDFLEPDSALPHTQTPPTNKTPVRPSPHDPSFFFLGAWQPFGRSVGRSVGIMAVRSLSLSLSLVPFVRQLPKPKPPLYNAVFGEEKKKGRKKKKRATTTKKTPRGDFHQHVMRSRRIHTDKQKKKT